MRILMTGASSFTGFWFARELARRGNDVVCPMTKSALDDYVGIRRERVEKLSQAQGASIVFSAGTQSENLAKIVSRERFDVFCNHAFASIDHKSPNYSPARAIAVAVNGLDALMSALNERGCNACVHSGTYFELGESERSECGFFTPYAATKSMAWEFVRYWANRLKMKLGKFVIPNPVGAFEERGLTAYLAKEWLGGRTPTLQTPHHTRDNAPVSALAERYAEFLEKVVSAGTIAEPLFARPSGYVMKNNDWVKHFGEKLFGACPEFICRSRESSENTEPECIRGRELLPPPPNAFWRDWEAFYRKHYSVPALIRCGVGASHKNEDSTYGSDGICREKSDTGTGENSWNADSDRRTES